MEDISRDVYTFPFSTCEKPREGISQPFSALFNVLTCSVLLFFLVQTKTFHAFMFLSFLLLFELFHTLSHTIHIPGSFLMTCTHVSGFFVNVSLLYLFYKHTGRLPPYYYFMAILGLLLADIYAFFFLSFIYFSLTQILVFLLVLHFYYPFLSKLMQTNLFWILVSTICIYLAFLNESVNCKTMLKEYPDVPFHLIIEIIGIVPVYLISKTVYNL